MSAISTARQNMVDGQVRPSDVTDRRIIRAMLEVPREVFGPRALQVLAYMDEAVPAVEPAVGRSGRTARDGRAPVTASALRTAMNRVDTTAPS